MAYAAACRTWLHGMTLGNTQCWPSGAMLRSMPLLNSSTISHSGWAAEPLLLPSVPPTAAAKMEENADDSWPLKRRMPLGASLESLRLEFVGSSEAELALAALLLLRRFDAEVRLDGMGRMPDTGAEHRGHVMSRLEERASMRERKHLKCMRCPQPDTNMPMGAGNGDSPSLEGGMDHPVHATARTEAAADDDAEMASNCRPLRV